MDLRYPIGKLQPKSEFTPDERRAAIESVAQTPAKLRAAVAGLTNEQLDTPYRPEGWTVRQVVHHLSDAHMIAFLRFKRALTEDEPPARPYMQKLWADFPDGKEAPAEISLVLLESLHARWVTLMRSMSAQDFSRRLLHPERGPVTLDNLLNIYAWHGPHHTAHITSLRERMGWK